MLKSLQTLFLLLMCFVANTQTHHFIYIESISKQPFTAQLNGNSYEAVNKNFVIIPKLENGVYKISISTLTASNKKFTVEVNDKDLGFSLKQDATGDLALFDINQFTTLQEDGKANAVTKENVTTKKEIETATPIVEKSKPKVADSATKTLPVEVAIDPEKKPLSYPVKKIFEKKKKDGIDVVYVDISATKTDTVSIFIPYEKLATDTLVQAAKPAVIAAPSQELKPTEPAPIPVENTCTAKATERDVADFSAKIQAALMLKQKLKLAATTLKEKCYTVNQIKRLGILFLNESGKFNFYKLSQTSIVDSNNFSLLEKELKDEKIKEEFKALIK